MFKRIKSFIQELSTLGPVLAFAVLAPGLGVLVLTSTSESWLTPLKNLGNTSIPIFLLATMLLAGLSLIPTHAASLVAGMLYGALWGPAYAIGAIMLASLLSFFVTARLVGDRAMNSLCQRPKAFEIYRELLKHDRFRSIFIIALVRLSPIMPFAGTNVLLAAAKVRLFEFVIGSLIGLTPRIVIVAIAGAGLTSLDLKASSHQGLFVVGILATIAAIIILGSVAKKVLKRVVNT